MLPSKPTIIARILAMVAGINKHYATTPQLAIAGANYTPAMLVTTLEGLATMLTDVDSAEASYKAKLAAANAQAGPVLHLLSALTAFVRATSGNSPDVLVDFGIAPKKPPTPLTSAQAALAAEKRAATRKARNTMGSKQKKAVKGTVAVAAPDPTAAVTPSPVVAPAAATPAK